MKNPSRLLRRAFLESSEYFNFNLCSFLGNINSTICSYCNSHFIATLNLNFREVGTSALRISSNPSSCLLFNIYIYRVCCCSRTRSRCIGNSCSILGSGFLIICIGSCRSLCVCSTNARQIDSLSRLLQLRCKEC